MISELASTIIKFSDNLHSKSGKIGVMKSLVYCLIHTNTFINTRSILLAS